MLIVRYDFNGNTFFLRGTVWTSDRDRATVFKTEDEAKLTLAKRHRVVGSMGYSKRQIKDEAANAKIESKE